MSFITSPGVIFPPLTAGGVAYGTGIQAKVNTAGILGQYLISGGAGVPTFTNLGTFTTVNCTNLVSSGTAASSFTVTSGTAVPLTITNVGTGNSFVVQDSANPDTSPFVIDATGNLGIGNINPTERLTVTGNAAISGTITEAGQPVVVQTDIGTAPNEIPLNQYLGEMAFMSAEAVVIQPQASAVPDGIGDMVFQLTSNTSLVVKVKGSDGTVRSVTLTLA